MLANATKKTLFLAYVRYVEHAPFAAGKGFAGRLVDRLGLARYSYEQCVLELNPYAFIDRQLIAGREHDADVGAHIRERLAHGGVFLDVGANIGVFSLAAARLPGVEVHAFEPSPRELARLYRNLALNGRNNVVVYPFALGDTVGSVDLSLAGASNPGMNSVLATAAAGGTRIGCRCFPLDDILPASVAGRVRVVKLDVEGYEMQALHGMSSCIERMRDVSFVVEVTRSLLQRAGSSADELYAFFAARQFRHVRGQKPEDQWNEVFLRP